MDSTDDEHLAIWIPAPLMPPRAPPNSPVFRAATPEGYTSFETWPDFPLPLPFSETYLPLYPSYRRPDDFTLPPELQETAFDVNEFAENFAEEDCVIDRGVAEVMTQEEVHEEVEEFYGPEEVEYVSLVDENAEESDQEGGGKRRRL